MKSVNREAQIYLASSSPRRISLLQQIGIKFIQIEVNISEERMLQEHPQDYVLRLALEKARKASRSASIKLNLPILGADTAVIVGNKILGKPTDMNHAMEMLSLLSGRTHKVLTAIAVVKDTAWSSISETSVTFRDLSEAEIESYCLTDEPWDKAGAYAIQGKAAVFVKKIIGSYSGVMGLPLFETAQCLEKSGTSVFDVNVFALG